ncbi:MAG: DUF2254 domain-containing protein [Methylophaga sp.]
MFSKWRWLLSQLLQQMWLRSALFGVLAIMIALLAVPLEQLIDNPLPFSISSNAVGDLLDILASSMLAVTTFSLGVMVTAFGSASAGATPRANQLVKKDTTSQNVLATFLGSFIYSLVGIIALHMNVYGETGLIILFATTVGIIALIVITILRWIDHLSKLGRLAETTKRIEIATQKALQEWRDHPCLGGKLLENYDIPADAVPIYTDLVGYIQHIDTGALASIATERNAEIAVLQLTGKFVHAGEAIAWLRHSHNPQVFSDIRNAFTIGDERSFEQDPRFGLCVLAEIASRALSPAVNDPGTAIDILGRGVRVLQHWGNKQTTPETVVYDNLWVPTLGLNDLLDDLFLPIARDAAGLIEVHIRLQKSLLALTAIDAATFADEAKRIALQDWAFANVLLALDSDKQRLQQLLIKFK